MSYKRHHANTDTHIQPDRGRRHGQLKVGSYSNYANRLRQNIDRVHSTHDPVTAAHVARMGEYTRLIARKLGLSARTQIQLYFSSPLHDIGKVAIPDAIVGKPGNYGDLEKKVMRMHTVLGARLLRGYRSRYLLPATEIALFHHERWDGSGYPFGLRGNAIPLSARIVAICDVYDALRSRRPYKEPIPHQEALTIITEGDDWTMPRHFDPAVLAAFIAQSNEIAHAHVLGNMQQKAGSGSSTT